MNSVVRRAVEIHPWIAAARFRRIAAHVGRIAAAAVVGLVVMPSTALSAEPSRLVVEVPDSVAATVAEMKPYTDVITDTAATFDMVPIPGGTFSMGSPATEVDRNDDEGPQHEVEISPFWMGKCEVTWDEYDIFSFDLDINRRKAEGREPTEMDKLADAVTKPTKPYTDMTFGMGKDGYPAICMTQLAAKKYCEWLSAKTGRYYRLPTEAEWEYACRAGTTTAYSFGDDPSQIDDYAWYYENSDDAYHPVGQKKPNPWGLYDMHGNVNEWCLDGYDVKSYAKLAANGTAKNPLVMPTTLYNRVARGGSWYDDPDALRSAARLVSSPDWKRQDPQIPQSIWFHTDAQFLGFRVIRPLKEPIDDDKTKYAADKFQQ